MAYDRRMKKIFLLFLVFLFTPLTSVAAALEAKPLADLITTLERTKFEYQETGLAFGYIQIQSCLYVSESMIVLKNYCYPKKNYPAKGYRIISAKFGMIDLYQEDHGSLMQRDVLLTSFPELLAPYLPPSLKAMRLAKLNSILEEVYYKYLPACWSTNHSFYTQSPEAKCTVSSDQVLGFPEWAAETQALTLDEKVWLQLMQKLEQLF